MQPFHQAERSIAKIYIYIYIYIDIYSATKGKRKSDLYMSQNKACNVKSSGKSKVLVIEVYLDIPC